jgi:hypothetical protein
MDGVWTTYNEAAARLGVTPEAVRRRAIRNKWARMPGNDGKTRVMVPDELHPPRTPHVPPHVTSDTSALVSALREHNATLKGDVELLKGQLVTERERADRATTELVALTQRLVAVEEARAALAEEQSRPLWRRVLDAATRSAKLGLISFTARSIVTHVALVSAGLALLWRLRG